MNRITKLIGVNVIFVLTLMLLSQSLFSLGLNNRYVKLSVYPNANFRLDNNEGSVEFRTDNNKRLLYSGSTTFGSVNIDGEYFFYGGREGNFIKNPVKNGNRIESIWNIKGVHIKQTLKFVKNRITNNLDTLFIKYEAKNTSRNPHQVGIRIMLDTMLGRNDGSPFKVPGFGDIITEKMIFNEAIPPFWYCYDNFARPNIVSLGTLTDEGLVKPDRVLFGPWSKIKRTPWVYQEQEGRSFSGDTAVALYYDPVQVNPGRKIGVATKYGVMGFKLNIKDNLSLMLGGDNLVKKPPFLITADVYNKGNVDFDAIAVKLKMPKGFQLVIGKKKMIYAKGLKPAKTITHSWRLAYDNKIAKKGGPYTFKIIVLATRGDKSYKMIKKKKVFIQASNDVEPPILYMKSPYRAIYSVPGSGKVKVVGYVADNTGIAFVKINGIDVSLKDATSYEIKKLSSFTGNDDIKFALKDLEQDKVEYASMDQFIDNTHRSMYLLYIKRLVKQGIKVKRFTAIISGIGNNSTIKLECMDFGGNLTKKVFLYR